LQYVIHNEGDTFRPKHFAISSLAFPDISCSTQRDGNILLKFVLKVLNESADKVYY